MEVNGCPRTPWRKDLDGRKLHEALGGECDLELRGSAVPCTSSTWSLRHLQVYAVLKGVKV